MTLTPEQSIAAYIARNKANNHTGRAFALDPFFLNLGRDGSGNIGFPESDAQYEDDGETHKTYIYVNVPASEFIALRDYLLEAFPLEPPAQCPHGNPLSSKCPDCAKEHSEATR